MNFRQLCGVFIRVILSVIFAGIFYTAWLAVFIAEFRSGLESIVLKALLWLAAPVATALGFTTGVFIFELLPGTRKNKFSNVFKWSLVGCAIGAGSVVWFGPMLIVFGMFVVGTASIAIREIIRLRKDSSSGHRPSRSLERNISS